MAHVCWISSIPYYVDCFEAMKLDGAAVHDHPLQELSCKNGQVTDRTIQTDTFQTAVSSNTITAFPRAPSSFPTPLASHQPLHAPLSNNLQSSACPKSIWHCTCRNPQLPQQGFVKMMRPMWQKNRALTQGKPCSCRASFNNLWLLQAKLLHCTTIRKEHGWLTEFCLLHIRTFHDFGTFGTDNSSSPLTSPLGHSSTDPRDHTLVNQ